MWIFFTGYLLSGVFEHGTVKLFKNRFHNETLSLKEILIGWLFQEHIEEEFDMTAGKKFVLEQDYRSQLLTHIFEISKDLVLYSHLIITLELGTFLLLLCFFTFIISKIYWLNLKDLITSKLLLKICRTLGNNQQKNYETVVNLILRFIRRNWHINTGEAASFCLVFLLLKNLFMGRYFQFDLYFVLRPIILASLLICAVFSFLHVNYLLYIYLLNVVSKKLAFLVKLVIKKHLFYFTYFCGSVVMIIHDFNVVNSTTENFFKEILFTSIFFFLRPTCLQ